MYSRRSNLILGFHGCDKDVALRIINNEMEMSPSEHDYDWLGHGIYFWENNYERALHFAKQYANDPYHNIKTPFVLGAVIDLGYCLDFLESKYLDLLHDAYDQFKKLAEMENIPMPRNVLGPDKVLRKLDCAVIEFLHKMTEEQPFDSVRGVFFEGNELYPNAGFKEKNHIQLCIKNPDCIKGFFIPRV